MSSSDGEPQTTPLTCPSGRCQKGSVLLGVVGPDNTVGYVRPALPVTPEFVALTSQGLTGQKPETRFRFAEPCQTSHCAHWSGTRCGVVDRALHSAPGRQLADAEPPLPHCAIRSSCRWFHQSGRSACAICPYMIHSPVEPSAGEVMPGEP